VKRNLVAEAETPSCLKGLLPYLITALKNRPDEERLPPIRLSLERLYTYIYFIGSKTLPYTCYILSAAAYIPF